MSEFEAHLGLLPTGFVDLMPDDAEKEASAINALMGLFTGYGYRRIKPPLMEFEDSLLAPGPGASLSKETFRVMDPVSRRMLGVRADITPQIARIVCTRLPKDQAPMRLTYANDVLHASAGQLRTARQFTQVGCEITGDDSRQSYAESATLAIMGLKAIGIADITLDLTLPRLVDALVDAWGLKEGTRHALLGALDKRDRDSIGKLDFDGKEIILSLLDATGYAKPALDVLVGLKLPAAMKQEAEKLQHVVSDIQKALDDLGITDVNLTFDAFETKGFEYHSGIAFTLFAKSIRGELGRGGHYNIAFGSGQAVQNRKNAIGFTLYMDTIRPAVMIAQADKILAVAVDVPWHALETLRNEGWGLVRVQNEQNLPEQVTHIYKNGKPEER